jgi:flagellin
MTRINTNVQALRGLRGVQNAQNLLGTSLSRLSSGLQINSGKDDPSGLIAAETLKSQVTVIEQSIKNSGRASNIIATADSALGEIGGLLNQVRGLVQQGLNKGALSQDEIDANQLQIDTALSAINRISSNTSFAGTKLLDGSKSFVTAVSTADAAKLSDFQVNEAVFGSNSTVDISATVLTAAKQGTLTYQAGSLSSAATVELSGAKGSQVLFFGASSTYKNITDGINATSDVTGVTATSQAATGASLTVVGTGTADDIKFTAVATDNASGVGTAAIQVAFTGNTSGSQALSVSVSGSVVTVALATDTNGAITSTATAVAAAVNANTSASALVAASAGTSVEGSGTGVVATHAAASLSGGSNALLTISSQNYGSKEFVDVNVLSGSLATKDLTSTSSSRNVGTDIVAQINGQAAHGDGLKATIKTDFLDASIDFKTANNVAAETAHVTVTGGGSLFQIGQQVSAAGQIGIGIQAVNTARLGGVSGKVYELGSNGGKSLNDVGPSVSGSSLTNILDEAISKVATLRGRLGALQKNVIETNVSSLNVALENINQARSQIVDTDFASETANLTKAQILSQASISVLQIANQSPNQVLSLLRG